MTKVRQRGERTGAANGVSTPCARRSWRVMHFDPLAKNVRFTLGATFRRAENQGVRHGMEIGAGGETPSLPTRPTGCQSIYFKTTFYLLRLNLAFEFHQCGLGNPFEEFLS
jgi:hypothetical protein